MAELIAIIVLFSGFIGIGIILFRKIPVLAQLPEVPTSFDFKIKIQKIAGKIKNSKYLKTPPFEILLQKVLSKVRILTLKIENKTGSLLQKLREKSEKKKENDQYWRKLKKSIKEDKSEENKNNLPR
jgi:hypothetical protein